MPAQSSRPRRLLKWFALLFGLCLIVTVLAGLLAGGDDTASDTADTSVSAAATLSPAKSQETEPGGILALAGDTDPTPVPEAPPTPQFSPAEQAYIDQVLETISPIPDATQKIGELSLAAGENTALLLDEDWRMSMALQLGIVKGTATLVQDLQAPPRFAAVQAELVTMAKRMDEGATLYATGIDDLDGAKITQASAKFEEGTAAMQRVSRLVVELSESTAAAAAPTPAMGATATKGANLRAGPATTFKVVGGVKAGDGLEIVGKNKAGDWYQLAGGQWIAAFLVTNPPAVPVVEEPAAAAPAPTSVPAAEGSPQPATSGAAAVPVANRPPTAADSGCPCDGNTLNCDDFTSVIEGWDAQACYLHCKELTNRDVHDLDRDSDGAACEWTWSE